MSQINELELARLCADNDPVAQRQFYNRFAPKMLGVCRRYVIIKADAEDILTEAMFNAMAHISQFEGQGSLEGWLRRITVNQALMHLRKNKRLLLNDAFEDYHSPAIDAPIEHQLSANDILSLLDELPTGYRTVFNLYVLDGLKHQEIADLLQISINTSKTQLHLAKQRLQTLIVQRFGKDFHQP